MSKTKVSLKKIDYTKNNDNTDAKIHLFGRKEDGERVQVTSSDPQPYFYVMEDEYKPSIKENSKVVEVKHGYEDIHGNKCVRICTRIPGDVPELREGYKHREADILWPDRVMLDHSIKSGFSIESDKIENNDVSLSDIDPVSCKYDPRVVYFDIEVDDSKGFPDEEKAERKVISISFYDSFSEEYYILLHSVEENIEHEYANIEIFENEKNLFKRFCEYLKSKTPDYLSGWNAKYFDIRYLINRLENIDGLSKNDLSPIGVSYDEGDYYGGKVRGIAVVDLLKGYKNLQFTEMDSFKLDNVGEKELGYGKVEYDKSIYDLWKEEPQKLVDYNVRDVKITVELDNQEGIIDFFEAVKDFVGGRIEEVIDYSDAVDQYLLRKVNGRYVVPSKDTVDSTGDTFEGAEVFEPSTEIKNKVSVLDLASLYPNSMRTLNAGIKTKDKNGDIEAPNGVRFDSSNDSILVEMIEELIDERNRFKKERDSYSPSDSEYEVYDRQQTAIKVITNALYGTFGWSRFRLYDEDVASAVTATGREVINFTQEITSKRGYDVIYGDTDSIMIEMSNCNNLPEVVSKCFDIEKEINSRYDSFAKDVLNADEHWLEIEFEKVYWTFIQAGKKKRYAGHIVWKDGKEAEDIDIVGFEYQRSDYSKKAKDLQLKVIENILMGSDMQDISNLVRTEIEKMKNLDYTLDELGIPGGIGQSFDSYDNKTKHVRAAEYANQWFDEEIQPGDKPKGIYVEKILWEDEEIPQPPQLDSSAFICWMNSNNVPDSVLIDWEKYMNIQITGPLSRIIECTDWLWDEIIKGVSQSGINSFGKSSSDNKNIIDVSIDKEVEKSNGITSNSNQEPKSQANESIPQEVDKVAADKIHEKSITVNSKDQRLNSTGEDELNNTNKKETNKSHENDDNELDIIDIDELDNKSLEKDKEVNKDEHDQAGLTDFS